MKKIINHIFVGALCVVGLASCHKLEVPITSELTPAVFPQNPTQFTAAAGAPYAAFRGNFSLDYWFMQELSTDEAILPARGGNWYDPGNGYNNLHYHNWTQDNGWTNSTWKWLSQVVGSTNQALDILKTTMPEGDSKKSTLAELKTLRALTYFMFMDLYGSVPLDTSSTDFTPHANLPRATVFNFIESEIKSSLPYLASASGTQYYGRVNKYTAYALLAKMYLNAQYYTGTARYNECIAACDSVINSNLYAVEPRSSYLQMFYPNNGPQMKEFIFAIPNDPSATAYPGTNGMMYRARYDLNRNLGMRYLYSGSTPGTNIDPVVNLTTGGGLKNSQPSGPESTLPEFYVYFKPDANDIRNNQWLRGPQYWADGTPIMVKAATKGGTSGYDATYTGADAGQPYTYQLYLYDTLTFRSDPKSGANPSVFDLGNDEIAWNMGIRNIKFYPDNTNTTNRNQNNDVPVFRFSDIILMKAEAELRGGTVTSGQTPLSLVNMIRSNRTTSPAWTSVALEDLYQERSREFTWETWHRNDMIRFGKFENPYGFKTDADPKHRVFPIPASALGLNPKLQQVYY
jgi:hypothetical protein